MPSRRWWASRLTPQQIERAAELASGAARPIDDHRGSIEFRNHLVRVLTRRTLTTALAAGEPLTREEESGTWPSKS